MDGLTSQAPMTELLRQRGAFDRAPFVLIDAGCSGGIDEAWRAFGPSLVAHAYDPDIAACEELQARERFEHVHYHARHVGLPESHPFARQRREDATRWPNTNIWGRVTAGYLAERAQNSAPPEDAAPAAPPRVADPSDVIGVAEIVRAENLATVDFLKIDVDGPDLEVLESARDMLTSSRVLGVGMEVNWFGSANPSEHTFHNTDRFLREQGFTLFGVTLRRYSRTDLPAPFEKEAFAYTHFGQPYQGDGIYVRDLASDHQTELAAEYPPEKLLKLACLYELIGVPDCAAEILNRFESRLWAFGDTEPLLDALTPPLHGERLSYREYVARFKREPELFLPSAAPSSQASSPNCVATIPPGATRRAGRRVKSWVSRRRQTLGSLRHEPTRPGDHVAFDDVVASAVHEEREGANALPLPCIACGGPLSSPRRLGAARLAACETCGSRTAVPRPSLAETSALHDSEEYFEKEYFDARRDRQAVTERRAQRILALVAAKRPEARLANARVLDIGCDTGEFASALARLSGADAYGVDVAARPLRRAQELGVEVSHGDLSLAPDHFENYALVTAIDVIEHVPDPGALLREIRGRLGDGGVVYLETPNWRSAVYTVGSFAARMFGSHPRPAFDRLFPPEHVQYFTPDGLRALVTRVGFRPLAAFAQPLRREALAAGPLVAAGTGAIQLADRFTGREILLSALLEPAERPR